MKELENAWTLNDVLDAHLALDALDDAQEAAEAQARNEQKRRDRTR